jgi:hypothetical protein
MMNRRKFLLSLLSAAGYQLLSPLATSAARKAPLLRIAVISDLNHSYGTIGYDPPVRAAIKRVLELNPDLVLCTGDMIAGQRTAPKLKQKRLESMWRSFHETVTQPLHKAHAPLAPTAGNHDASASPGFNLERDVYRDQWGKNRPALTFLEGGNYPFYYAFTINRVLFASLDATVTRPLDSEQLRWLTKVLNGVGQSSRARVIFGHIPLCPLTVGRERGFLRDTRLEQLFIDKSVSVYLSGHQHGFYPFYHNGQYYVGQGALGSGPRRLIGDKKRSPRSFTVIEIANDGTLNVMAYTGSDFKQLIQRSSLPAEITSNGCTIVRDDLAG